MIQSKYIPGDLVKASGQLCRVEEVFVNRLTKEFEYTLVYPNSNSSRIVIGEIEPVPLTPEILSEDGWAYYTHCDEERIYLKDYKGELLYIGVYEDDGEYIVHVFNGINDYNCASDYYLRSVKYVHQLQHLLFGLGLNSEMNI